MKKWTVRQRIVMGFSAVVLIMVILSVFAFVLLSEIKSKASDVATDAWPGVYWSAQIESRSMSVLESVYRHMLSTDDTEKRQLEAEVNSNRLALDEAMRNYEQTIFRAEDRRLFTQIVSARTSCETAYKPMIDLSRTVRVSEIPASLRQQVDTACKELRNTAAAEVEDNNRLGLESNKRILNAVSQAEFAVAVSLVFGIILSVISGYLLVRAIDKPIGQLVSTVEVIRTGNLSQRLNLERQDEFGILADGLNLMTADLTGLIRRVQQSGLQVNTSSTEIAATSQEQLSTANEIAATTSEIGATSKEISATSKELVQTMKDVADVAEKTAALATNGQAGLRRMKGTMQQIVEASTTITDRLAVLSEKAGNIGTVVTTITKVADQTNLLSLNAAIEAEKAGEYGRGFAVVATEIRRLADQTAISTSDIDQTVKEMQSAVAAGVMGMDKFSEEIRKGVDVVQQVHEELSQILQQVQALTPSIESVSEGMQSQSQGAQQISDALSQLSEASRQTVESLRQSHVAIDQLNESARGLQEGVSRFTLQLS